jgi:hypothetical protein
MKRKPARWKQPAPGVKVLKLYETDLNPKWPRVVILELTAKKFTEFEHDALGFAEEYELFPDQPMIEISPCCKPPVPEGDPPKAGPSGWTVAIVHGKRSLAACAASPRVWP